MKPPFDETSRNLIRSQSVFVRFKLYLCGCCCEKKLAFLKLANEACPSKLLVSVSSVASPKFYFGGQIF